jgi:hypothetical protein
VILPPVRVILLPPNYTSATALVMAWWSKGEHSMIYALSETLGEGVGLGNFKILLGVQGPWSNIYLTGVSFTRERGFRGHRCSSHS